MNWQLRGNLLLQKVRLPLKCISILLAATRWPLYQTFPQLHGTLRRCCSTKKPSVLRAPSPSYFTQFHLPFDDVSQFHHFPWPISAKSRSGPLHLGRLVRSRIRQPTQIEMILGGFPDCHEIHFEKSLTPGLPTFLGIAGCHTKIRHLSWKKSQKLLLGSAQQIGWEWWTVRVMTFCSN